MISKITKLYGIGTLHAPLSNGALILKAKTIIYGENGRGKTTLVAVLRSLACGETGSLLQRNTIKGTHPQAAQVLIGPVPHDLTNGCWSKTHPEICVFDSTFISDNVYSGVSVDPDHRKNLLSFAIGSEGVSLARKVDKLAEQIAALRSEETANKERLKKFIRGNLLPEQFAYLPPADADAVSLLQVALRKRDAVARASTISTLQAMSPISFETQNLERLSESLAQTSERVATDAAERVRVHIESAQVMESWLQEGTRFDTGDNCPYCAQSIKGVSLVEAYRLSFSEAYTAFKATLANELEVFVEMLSGEKWLGAKSTIESNRTKLIPWREFLADVELSFETATHTSNVKAALAAIRSVIARKLASPLEAVTFSAQEITELQSLESTVTAIDDYNASQVILNLRLAHLKSEVLSGNLFEAETEVYDIENRIARRTNDADDAARAFMDAVSARKRFEHEKESARAMLNGHMKKVIGLYQNSINKHLQGCGTSFKIMRLNTVYTGAKPRFDYAIELFGTPVDLANKPGSPVVFESALSLGDKSALAFAFFLAKLENDPKRLLQTVIFDDPLSSLDSCRRRYTRQQISELAPKVAQLIILTHEEATVADIAMRLKETDCAIFELKAQGDFSVFNATTVKDITASDYARYFDSLSHYLHGAGEPEDVVKKVRPFMEMNLRYRFPEEFGPDQSLGKMIGHITSCDASRPLFKMNALVTVLREINDYTTIHSHGDKALVNTEKMLDSDLECICTKAIEFGRGLPN